MGAIEQLDAAIRLAAMLAIQRQKFFADLLDSRRGREGIFSAVDAQVGARDDQLVYPRGVEFLQQGWNEVKDAVTAEPVCRNQRLEIGEAAEVDGEPDPGIQRRQPPRLGR